MKKLTQKLTEKKFNYPILAWYENKGKSEVMIFSSAQEFRKILGFSRDLKDLYRNFESVLELDDLRSSAREGDDSIHAFALNEFTDSDPNWDLLLKDLERELKNQPNDSKVDPKVQKELHRNHKNDLAASALKCVYGSLFYTMITRSLELGITDMLLIGDIIYEEELSRVIENNLPDNMTMSFLQL